MDRRKTKFELKVLEHYGTYKSCEKQMNWSPGTITKIVRGMRELKASEIDRLRAAFEIELPTDFKDIFFGYGKPNQKLRQRNF